MYLVESKGGAIACMLLALVFLGTWPAILAQLERRGRLPQHTYLDYSLTNFFTALVIALTVGQIGDAKPGIPNFIAQLSQDNWPCILIAMAGGVFLSLGNLSTQYAWPFVGLSVTEVITSSIAVVLGTTLNYFLDDRINRAEILFPGVGCFLIAVCLGSAVHSSNAADNAAKLQSLPNYCKDGTGAAMVSDHREMVQYKGVLCGLGNGLQFMGGQAAGYAAADCVQALPLVSTFWGVLVFGEYRISSRRTYILLVSMLLMFIVAVGVLIASSGHRKN
ncbi:hypothetical protein RD792_001449 [Penstemon davidsonii]|uniref:Ureide permease n=1 Tax=Penstemon davidsonii TaxID=160366 RepID=A0ABR0DNG3_9LAMI|nr:hypothetical protein RD792_001449 [Penstemon davidsonii]